MIDQTRLEQFQEILRVVGQMFPGSHPVIGGGALRDSILGRPIKDVDVFIRAQDFDSLDSPHTTFIRPPIIVQRGYGRDDMYGAWDLKEQIAGYDVQLILADFNDPFSLADSFDLGIARVTYDGNLWYVAREFEEDSRDKVFRIRRADNQYEFERSVKRIKRLQEKYPDFTVDHSHVPALSRCPSCRTPILRGAFRNAISVKEYGISGLCQKCQDSVFGID